MRTEILDILQCPVCRADMGITPIERSDTEVRKGSLACKGAPCHAFEIRNGIACLATDFDQDAVQGEIAYSRETFTGDPRLEDPDHVSQYPDTCRAIWPHTKWFGPDFRAAIEQMRFEPDSWTLDVGTGACWTCRLLAQAGARVVAQDVVETKFNGLGTGDILFEKHGVYFDRVLESMTLLPYKDSSISHVVFNASFHHSPDEWRTLSECYRVLKPGGVVALIAETESVLGRYFGSGTNSRSVEQGSSHHEIAVADFERTVKQTRFRLQFLPPEHFKWRLRDLLKPSLGSLALKTFEIFPYLLRYVTVPTILLHKPASLKQ